MAIPVFARNPFVDQQGVSAMSRIKKRVGNPEVGSNTHDEDSMTVLRDTEIGCIKKADRDIVSEIRCLLSRLKFFETRKVPCPCDVVGRDERWVAKLEFKVAKIWGKALPFQATDVFKQERQWADLANGPYCLREEISRIVMPLVPSALGKRLTRGTAEHDVDFPSMHGKIISLNGSLDDLPIPNEFHAPRLILLEG
jgi:hypothetical protein